MAISSEFIDELKFRCDIEDVVSSYVTLKRAGSNYNGLCPFHNEKTPSFTVFPATRTFYCFGCGAGGDVISFVMKMENLDYPSAIERLAARAGLPMPVQSEAERTVLQRRERTLAMNKEAARYFHDCLFSELGKEGLAYLEKRGLSTSVIRHFGLGFAPDSFGGLTDLLRRSGYRDEEAAEAFLCGISKKTGRPYDYFRNRVIFPIIDTAGRVVAFGGRVMDDSKPKYLNTSDTPAFKKSRNLFALNFARTHCAQQMILCEGYMDVIALHRAGFENAVATLGTAITPEHARMMARYTKSVVIAYDMDTAGRNAADKAIGLLQSVGLDVRVLNMSGAKDPDEFIVRFGAERFRQRLTGSESQLDYRCEAVLAAHNLESLDQRVKAAAEICQLLAGVYSEVERDAYAVRMATRLEIQPDTLRADIRREVQKRRRGAERDRTRQEFNRLSGITDRLNPDHARVLRANAAEDTILGILLLFPELIPRVSDAYDNPVQLKADQFLTAFNRGVYEAMVEVWQSNGRFDLSYLGERFTTDEMARITGLSVRRQQLTKNDEYVLLDSIAVLREENEKQKVRAKETPDVSDLAAMLDEKRKKSGE